jgi:hypothetical protein
MFTKSTPQRQAQPQPSGSAHKRTTGGRLTSKLRRMITNGRRAASRAPDSRDTVNIRGRWTAPCMFSFSFLHRTLSGAP